ncbi:hypothetical protein V1264_012279 [Littorina saxatilis]|uniref:G-protein coupled receptors family 1 profile domain-containing protein n=1 Tax=Littorina saxatilis TaxID=31220 RepID=A0AAN9BWY6_9CAEN
MDSNNSSQGFPPPSVCSSDLYWRLAQLVVTLTLILVIVTNLLMLLVTWHAISTRINPYFFVSLAMSDLLTGVFVLPFHLAFAARSERGIPGHAICTFSGVTFHILQTVSLFSFFALSLDRLVSINFPLKYPNLLTRQVNVAILLVIWLMPTLMYGLIPATGLGQYVYKCWQSMCNLGPIDTNYLTVLMLLCVAVFLATYAINGRIFYIARQQQAKISNLEQQFHASTGHSLKFKARMRAARSIMMALGLFTLCWGPYYATLFCLVLFNAAVTPVTEFVLLWIAISNSYMNFFVFLATYRSFRTHFMRLVGLGNRVRGADVTTVSSS